MYKFKKIDIFIINKIKEIKLLELQMYSKDEYKNVILQSIYKNDLTFDDDYQKMEIIATLRMFLDKYDFEDFIKNYVISHKEYNKYYKPFIKVMRPKRDEYFEKQFNFEKFNKLLKDLGEEL